MIKKTMLKKEIMRHTDHTCKFTEYINYVVCPSHMNIKKVEKEKSFTYEVFCSV